MSYGSVKDISVRDYRGRDTSHKLARDDSGLMEQYKSIIKKVGRQYGVEPALIAGIISRESSAGATLNGGWGDNGKAWGLMQVDVTPNGGNHTPRGAWNSEEHLCQATDILVYFIKRIREKFPSWSRAQQLKGGIAAYNMGDGNVREGYDVDAFTHGQNYSSDVVARAQYYKDNCGY